MTDKKDIDLTQVQVDGMPKPPMKPKRPDPSGQRPINAPPLMPGQVVKVDAAGPSLTPQELAMLQKTGWKEGDPLPDNVEMARRMALADNEELVPPVPLDTPPLQPTEAVDISQLSPERQAQVMNAVNTGQTTPSIQPGDIPPAAAPPAQLPPDTAKLLSQPAATAAPTPAPAQATRTPMNEAGAVSVASQAVPGWTDPNNPGYTPTVPNPLAQGNPGVVPQVAPPEAANQPPMVPAQGAVEMNMPAQPAAQPATAPPVAEPVMAQPDTAQPEKPTTPIAEPDDMGLGDMLQECPHCGWDLSAPAIPEPSYGEKQAFLQSILGQKPFLKDYVLLGGAVRARFRTLTTPEIDTVFKQVLWERQQGMIATVEDYWEKINRYRLYLQLSRLEGKQPEGFLHDLPDGYTREANPGAVSFWKFECPPEQTGLPLIENWLIANVLRTESLQRVINNQCSQFNRLVARLEALVDNSDFWSKTAEQS